ncbi:Zinc-finger homeodomain protein 11 [Ananas comosus]|uniref:Zinc-finger homeodomain protein 11 n=1 Tax=Ananas comosus TaxID=4615 RepID=A0A199UR45_ANACO|nr:Zinc-finger homeodomain protein 11 [Ananas comosus]
MERERVVQREVYKECMRNHAAKLGTYAADGCCEYTADEARPGSLSCAACGCHRNFHRKVFLDGHRRHDHQQQPAAAQTQAAEERRRRCPEGSKPRRARTKFTEEQKARMASFAERIGWKVPRRADGGIGGEEVGDDVTRFCLEIGVSRQVFKVWMHNHRSGGGGGRGGDGAASSSMSQTVASGGDEEAS